MASQLAKAESSEDTRSKRHRLGPVDREPPTNLPISGKPARNPGHRSNSPYPNGVARRMNEKYAHKQRNNLTHRA